MAFVQAFIGTAVAQTGAPPPGTTAPVGPPTVLAPREPGLASGAVPLVPPSQDMSPASGSAPDAGAPAAPSPVAGHAPSAAAGEDDAIVVDRLATVDPSSAGVLTLSDGGFGPDMWAGSDRSFVERMVPRLPVRVLSPVMQDLARRLLLSEAIVPPGEASVPSLIGLRVERLVAAGRTDDARRLARLAPASLQDPALRRAEVDSMLLSGDNAGACAAAESDTPDTEDPYWLRLLAFCKAIKGEAAAAQIALTMIREQGAPHDESFSALMGALAGDSRAATWALFDPTPLHLAALRAAKLPVPADAVPGAGPPILRAIATAPNTSLDVRLAAAERAEAAGALPTSTLTEIYAGIEFTESERAQWRERIEDASSPAIMALLYQVANVESDPDKRAAVVVAALRCARSFGGYETAARALHDVMTGLTPAPALAWAATEIGRALLVAGDVATARQWFAMVQAHATDAEPDAAVATLDLWPLMQVTDGDGVVPWSADSLRAWMRGDADRRANGESADRAARLCASLDGLGYEVPSDAWQNLFDGSLTVSGYLPSPAVWRLLERVSREGRVGETVMLVLAALGDAGPSGANATTVAHVVRALQRVGLDGDARRAAFEFLVAGGF
jgi:hypothetical protein